MKRILFIMVGVSFFIIVSVYSQQVSEQSIEFKPDDWISYPVMRFVTCMDQGNEYIYFGTTGGICRYNFYKQEWDTPFTRSNGMKNDHIFLVFYDFTSGNLWCVTEEGLSYRIPTTGEWYNIGYPVDIRTRITALGSGEKFIWLKTGETYYQGDRFGSMFSQSDTQSAVQDNVRWSSNRAVDSLPNFFMNNREYIFDPQGFIKSLDLRAYRITCALEDNFRSIWIGTDGLGCGEGDIRTEQLRMLPFGLYDSDVQTMAWDEYTLWIGGHSSRDKGAITRWDQKNNSWEYFEALYLSDLRSDKVNDILVAEDTPFVWFATDDGLARYNKIKNEWKVYDVFDNLWDDYITSLTQTGDILWIGTAAGINRMQGEIIDKADIKSLNHRMIYRLVSDGNNLWAGTDKGKYFFNAEDKKWSFMKGVSNVLNVDITAMDFFNKEVWFAGNGGLEMYDMESKSWQGYPSDQYPIPEGINALLNNGEILWIASEQGLVKFVKKENHWRRFTEEDGLLDNSLRWIIPDGDYIWLASPAGITQFYWNAPYRID